MPDSRASRFAFEVLFLVALAVAVVLADLRPLLIAGVMLVGWVIVALLEWAAWRDEPHYASGLPPRYYVPQVSLPPRQPLEQVARYPSAEQRDDAPTWIASAALRAEVLGAWPVAPVSAGEDTQAEEPSEPVAEEVSAVVAEPEPELAVADPEPEVAAAEPEPESERDAEPEPVVAAAVDDGVGAVEAVGGADGAEPLQEAEPELEPEPDPQSELGGEPEPFVAAALGGAVAGESAATRSRRRWFWQRRREPALEPAEEIGAVHVLEDAQLESTQVEKAGAELEEEAELEGKAEQALEAGRQPEPEPEPEPEPQVVPAPMRAADADRQAELAGDQAREAEPEPEPEPEPAPVLELVTAGSQSARHRLDPLAEPEARRWPWQRQPVADHSVAEVPARPTGVRVLPGASRRGDA